MEMDKEKLKKYDTVKWAEVATLLPDRQSYQDLGIGLQKKNYYITLYLPELRDGTPRRILDIGAGTGVFCHVCQELGHETLAVLAANRPNRDSTEGYKRACEYFGVPKIDFTWGTEPADLEDDNFDLVNNQGMMGDNKVEIWHTMLDDMLRVLKPGGTLLLAANHESGTQYANVIADWGNKSNVDLIEYWKKKTIWKWCKK